MEKALSTTVTLEQVGRAASEASAAFELERFNARLAHNTLGTYSKSLRMFCDFVYDLTGIKIGDLQNDVEEWRGVSYGLCLAFQKYLLDQGYSAGAINLRIAAIKTYCRVAHRAGVLPAEEYSKIRVLEGVLPKRDNQGKVIHSGIKGARKNQPVFLTAAQMDILKDQPSDTPEGRRNAAVMCIFLDHGLRLGEVLSLLVENVDLEKGTFTFYREKVKIVQTHRMSKDTLKAVTAYLKNDRKVESGSLFVSTKEGKLTSRPMARSSTFSLIRELGRSIGIDNLAPHDLRHSWTRRAADSGTSLDALKDAGGWASVVMPALYMGFAKIANDGVKLGS